MGRPPLPIGTYGTISIYRTEAGYRARAKYRDFDGITRRVERHGSSRTRAENNLRAALRDRSRSAGGGALTRETRVNVLAEKWYGEFADQDKSPGTLRGYRDRLDNQVLPGLGGLRICELTPGVISRHLRKVADVHGAAVAKMTRSVLSGMCKYAAAHDALDRNPVRDATSPATSQPRKAPRALTVAEGRQLRAWLTYDDQAIARDLLDFVDMMMATGLRIGETAAITWDALELDKQTVEVRGTVIRITGKGLVLKPKPKSEAGYRTLDLPSWCVQMLRDRIPADSEPGDVAFPAVLGGLRDPSNTQADLRDAFRVAGFGWVTSHVFRKTVATLMDEAGLSARAAADQLGHAKPSVTQDVYYGRKRASTGAATVLESFAA